MLEAMLWVVRTGSSWRELPSASGRGLRSLAATNVGANRACGRDLAGLASFSGFVSLFGLNLISGTVVLGIIIRSNHI